MSRNNHDYPLIIDNLPDAFCYHQKVSGEGKGLEDYEFIDINMAFQEMAGLERKEIIGKNLGQVLGKIKGVTFDWKFLYDKVALMGERVRFQSYFPQKDTWYEVTLFSPREGFFVTLFRDITEFKENQARKIAILNALPDLMFLFNREGTYIDFHASNRNLLAVEPQEFLGKSLEKVLPLEVAETFRESFKRAHATKETQVVEYGLDTLGGAKVFEARITAMDDLRFLSVVRDITDRKELYRQVEERSRELEESNRKLQELNQELFYLEKSRTHLLANISHDLRTPITLIQGFTQALLEEVVKDPREQEKYLSLILNKAKGLNRLIDDLLQLTRLESGEIKMECCKVYPKDLAVWLFERYRRVVESRGLNYYFQPPTPEKDRGRLFLEVNIDGIERVYSNLICNSLKFTPPGGSISLAWEIPPLSSGRGALPEKREVLFKICDTGRGISPVDFPFIFDRFYQGSKCRNSSRDGRGLGLAIAREIISQHGGRVWAEKDLAEGSIFYFTLPLVEKDN